MNNSPLNNSISKQLYSFSKAERFKDDRKSPCKQSFYDLKNKTFTNRATSFGYGNKTDLVNKQPVPPPGQYEKYGEFQINLNKRRGYSFSRNSNRTIINQEQNSKLPGPGNYETDKDIKFSTIKFSFRSKFQSIFQKNQTNLGPGQYNTIELINKTGRHNVAKYEDSRSRSFSKGTRFQDIRAKTPGPGTYKQDEKLAINSTGSYFNSRFRSNNSNLFGRSNRPPLGPKTLSPGPGIYETFSEFNTIKH